MASLGDLGLNRYLYKDTSGTDSSEQASSTNGSDGSNGSSGGGGGPATSIAAGSIIQSCLIQSSPGDDRVEIDPKDDSFKAYRNGEVVVQIDRDGIFAEVVDVDVENLDVQNFFMRGEPQPQLFYGNVASNGVGFLLPGGWTSGTTGTGQYTITHGLGNGDNGSCAIQLTPITGATVFLSIVAQNANDFTLEARNAAGTLTNAGFTFAFFRTLP
jgi:hypothetical protein